MQVKKVTVRTKMKKTDWFQTGKEISKDVYCYSAYSTNMQIISCEMLGWMKCTLKSRFLGEISVTSETQMTPPLWQKEKN